MSYFQNEFTDTRTASIEISDQELALATRLLSRLVKTPKGGQAETNIHCSELAGAIYGARRERRHFFPETLFADPAWDILLTLYCAETEGETLCVSAVCVSADVPQTTALRWVNVLAELGFLEKCPHPTDGRSQLIRLTPESRTKMDQYFSRISQRQLQTATKI
jgi:DNA-binding MarR family transcriptional regulator